MNNSSEYVRNIFQILYGIFIYIYISACNEKVIWSKLVGLC